MRNKKPELKIKKAIGYVYWLMLILVLSTLFGAGYYHELAHKSIFEDYGIDSKIDLINYFPSFVTVPLNNYENCDSYCLLAHEITDSTNYFFLPFLALFSLFGVFIVLLLLTIVVQNRSINGNN